LAIISLRLGGRHLEVTGLAVGNSVDGPAFPQNCRVGEFGSIVYEECEVLGVDEGNARVLRASKGKTKFNLFQG